MREKKDNYLWVILFQVSVFCDNHCVVPNHIRVVKPHTELYFIPPPLSAPEEDGNFFRVGVETRGSPGETRDNLW